MSSRATAAAAMPFPVWSSFPPDCQVSCQDSHIPDLKRNEFFSSRTNDISKLHQYGRSRFGDHIRQRGELSLCLTAMFRGPAVGYLAARYNLLPQRARRSETFREPCYPCVCLTQFFEVNKRLIIAYRLTCTRKKGFPLKSMVSSRSIKTFGDNQPDRRPPRMGSGTRQQCAR